MPNHQYANEWLTLAWKNLETAKLLIREKHFTDSIAIEIHQVIEKSFKTVLAFYGKKIVKTHDLLVIYNLIENNIEITEDILETILIINDYYESEKYPGPHYYVPKRQDVEYHFTIASNIFEKIKAIIQPATK